jgi:uncharacterized protein YndB with AHSA1/START domain
MTRIVTTIRIQCPIEAVFDYVTTPANWLAWHPASRSVTGTTDHSLMVGDAVTEEFIAAGRHGSATWRVTRREAPYLWVIEMVTPGGRATIAYRLKTEADETVFERDLTYATSTLWLTFLDLLVIRRRMERESRVALQRLKAILETSAPDARGPPSEPLPVH